MAESPGQASRILHANPRLVCRRSLDAKNRAWCFKERGSLRLDLPPATLHQQRSEEPPAAACIFHGHKLRRPRVAEPREGQKGGERLEGARYTLHGGAY